MRPPHTPQAGAAFVAILAVLACSSASRMPAQTSTVVAHTQVDSAAVAQARADSVRRPYTTADVNFMSSMIGHHAQAIIMARMAPSHGASATVQRLADRIINSQQDEIATMQQWL